MAGKGHPKPKRIAFYFLVGTTTKILKSHPTPTPATNTRPWPCPPSLSLLRSLSAASRPPYLEEDVLASYWVLSPPTSNYLRHAMSHKTLPAAGRLPPTAPTLVVTVVNSRPSQPRHLLSAQQQQQLTTIPLLPPHPPHSHPRHASRHKMP